jgi:two-component system chemotaxis response regulator CheB
VAIKILIVDDSVVSRRLLSDLLGEQTGFEVVGTAVNGKLALIKIPILKPDLVVLDVEMPVMDGIETLREIKRTTPHIRVIMFSAHTQAGAAVTVEALTLGAEDYVSKPSNLLDVENARRELTRELVPKVRVLLGRDEVEQRAATVVPTVSTPVVGPQKVDVVTIGSSTGGPNALAEVFGGLPKDFPVPIVMVQHMPRVFTSMLAERLTRQSLLPVEEARDGMELVPGKAWIAPGGRHLTVGRRLSTVRTQLNDDPPENSCRPAVNTLFRSVAAAYQKRVLGVVLTGMGEDGMKGAIELRRVGAQILAQDQQSSVVWGMPGAVARAGAADKILPLDEIAGEIVRRVRWGR